jgi:hypothetical protein
MCGAFTYLLQLFVATDFVGALAGGEVAAERLEIRKPVFA